MNRNSREPRLLVTGGNGQVGAELVRTLASLGQVTAVDRDRVDLAEPGAVRDLLRSLRPHAILHSAAWTDVDRAEEKPSAVTAVNVDATLRLAREAARAGALLVHYSSEYVFDGNGDSPWTEEDRPGPLSLYGRSKLESEKVVKAAGGEHLIFRCSWIYGSRGRNFLLTILRLLEERPEVPVVNDQIGAPTWSRLVAGATAEVLRACRTGDSNRPFCTSGRSGLYHLACRGETSWFGFAGAVLKEAAARGILPAEREKEVRLVPIPTSQWPAAATRPLNSRLDCSKIREAFGVRLPRWEEGLRSCLDEWAERHRS